MSYTCTYSQATGYNRFIWSHTHLHTVLPLVTAGSFGVIHIHTVLPMVTAGSFGVIHIHTVLPLVTAGSFGVIHILTVLPLVTAGSFGVIHIHTVLPMVTASPFGVIHIHAVLPLVTAGSFGVIHSLWKGDVSGFLRTSKKPTSPETKPNQQTKKEVQDHYAMLHLPGQHRGQPPLSSFLVKLFSRR